jgi:hypothetical protein
MPEYANVERCRQNPYPRQSDVRESHQPTTASNPASNNNHKSPTSKCCATVFRLQCSIYKVDGHKTSEQALSTHRGIQADLIRECLKGNLPVILVQEARAMANIQQFP